MKEHEKTSLFFLVVIFLVIRVPGLSEPLHQDEYKWPIIANPINQTSDLQIPHPPLSEFIYRTAGELVGFNIHFRLVPLLFGTLSLVLFYYVLKKRFGKQVGYVGALLFTLSYFSILASLMVDTDGAVMPFFFLCMLLAYDTWRTAQTKKNMWLGLAVVFAILGLFIKVSFVLAIGAVVADFLWEKRKLLKTQDIIRYGGYGVGFIVGFIVLLILSQKLFPFFSLSGSVTYWEHFATGSRNWFQTFIQLVKAILYASPFLCLIPLFTPRHKLKELVPFLSYLIFGFIFYIILFDFSLGALDRYLQFIIIPLCALTAVAIVSVLGEPSATKADRNHIFSGTILSLLVLCVCFLSQSVPSLYPKSAWVSRVFSLHWNFLYVFSGGSGPFPFYVSFLFMALIWIVSLVLVVGAFFLPEWRKKTLLILIPLGLVYNAVFAEEYLFGLINGSAPHLLAGAVEFIKNNPDVKKVVVYNDNGGYEIQQIGKYEKRLYTSPEFDINEKVIGLNTYKDFYFELNIPRIDPASVYRRYLDSCPIVYNQTDHYISAIVYDCRKAPKISVSIQ